MMVLGAGFGFGVALAVSRLFAGLAPGLTIAGLVAGGLVGLLLTVWVVGIRDVLHDRAVLDRWVTDVAAALRSAVEERVATRVLAAETALTADLAARDEVESATAADRVAEIEPNCASTRSRPRGPPRCGTAGCRRCSGRSTRCAPSLSVIRVRADQRRWDADTAALRAPTNPSIGELTDQRTARH